MTQSGLDLQQVCISSGTTLHSFNTKELTILFSALFPAMQNTKGSEVYYLIEHWGVIVEALFYDLYLGMDLNQSQAT